MADPYYRYSSTSARADNAPVSNFPGYLSTQASNDLFVSRATTDYMQNAVTPTRGGSDIYGVNEMANIGLSARASYKGHPSPTDDPYNLRGRRQDFSVAISSGPSELINERPSSLRNVGDFGATAVGASTEQVSGESSILFVDGLPTDCTRREVGHLFRPFIGFKEIRVIHKEPRRKGDKAMVLCFVEFDDPKCALTAMEALQEYKFDDKKPNSPSLRIHFAQFPFRPPSSHDSGEERVGVAR